VFPREVSIREVCAALARKWKTPDLGNKDDPLDEIVYLVLAGRTREQAYRDGYTKLKARFPNWGMVLDAGPKELEELISGGGLEEIKAAKIWDLMAYLAETPQGIDLSHLKGKKRDFVLEYLLKLPGVGLKNALCVMIYSLNMDAFPADANVIRICKSMGWIPTQWGHKKSQRVLAELVPDEIGRILHVNMVVHGRLICRPANPQCSQCVIKGYCAYGRRSMVGD